MENIVTKGKSGQDIQDEIFRRMSPDEKVLLGARLWRLAKDIVGDKISYERGRPKTTFSKRR